MLFYVTMVTYTMYQLIQIKKRRHYYATSKGSLRFEQEQNGQ